MYARFILVTVALILSGCTANQYDNSPPWTQLKPS